MRVWIIVAAVISLAALGLATLPLVIDWDGYRSDIEAAAARLSGHDVTIRGPIEFTVFPSITLTAKDVAVTSSSGTPIGFELVANQADVALEVGPLLAGRPVVRDLRLRRPVLTIDRDGSQRLRSWPPRWQDWAAPVLNLDLKGIGFADGRLVLAGDRPEPDLSLHDLSLELNISSPGGPLEAVGLFKTDRHRFTMTAEFGRPNADGMSSTKLVIEAKNGIEETTSLRFSGRIKPFGDDQSLGGRLTLNGPDLQYGLAALSSATGYPSTFLPIAPSQTFAIEGQIEADRRGIRADDLQLRLAEKLGKGRIDLQLHPSEQLDLNLDLPPLRLTDDAGLSGFLPLDLLSKLQVPPGTIDIRLRELMYREEEARTLSLKLRTGQDRVTMVDEAKVQLPGLIDVKFEGGLYPAEIGSRLRGKIAAVGDDLKSSLIWLGLLDEDNQARGWRSFSLEGDVDVTSVEMALRSFDLRLDSSTLEGDAGLRFSERKRLSIDVDLNRPNLDLYWTDWDAKRASEQLQARLGEFDTDVDLRFTRLIWGGTHVEEGSVLAESDEGQLRLREVAAKTVGDTLLSVEGTIDLDERTADLRTKLNSEHPARALHHLKLALPLTSSRLRPLALVGSMQGALEQVDVTLKADYDGGEISVEGQAGLIDETPWYDLAVNARHPDHQGLASQFRLAPLVAEGDADGPLELTGRLRFDADTPWAASGNAKLGPTTFTGSLFFDDEPFASPFDAKLSVGSPRKDSLAPLLILTGLRLAGDWTPGRWLGRLPKIGLRTAWLDDIDGTLSLTSKGGLVGDGLKMDAKLNDGLLYIDEVEASPWGGTLSAELSLERRGDQPFAAMAVDLDQVSAADFVAWLGAKSGITGPLDLRLKASSAGVTPYDLMAGMAGDMEISVGPGELKGLGIPELRRFMVADGDEQDPADRSLTMTFNEIDTKAELSRGIFTIQDGKLRLGDDTTGSGAVEARIDGTADLLLWIVDLTLSTPDADASTDQVETYRLVGPPNRPDGYNSAGN